MVNLDANMEKLKNSTDKYQDLKIVVKDILTLNHIYGESEELLVKYGKKYNTSLFISKNINNFPVFLEKILNADDAKKMYHEFLQTDINLIRFYFNSILSHYYSWHKPTIDKDTLTIALKELKNNYNILEEIIFKFGNTALLIIEQENKQYFMLQDVQYLRKILKDKTCFIYFPQDYLDTIWELYSNKLLARARRGPKMMLTLFFLYESKFTDSMIDILLDRMKGYRNLFYIDYLIYCSSYLNEDYKNKLKSLKLMINLA